MIKEDKDSQRVSAVKLALDNGKEEEKEDKEEEEEEEEEKEEEMIGKKEKDNPFLNIEI